jgi:tetratricopeptide (TPR) repeat protein
MQKSFSFPYTEEMNRGQLVVQGVAAKGSKSKTAPEATIAEGVINTSRKYIPINAVAYAESGYNPLPEYEPIDVAFFFPQGSAQLRTSETRSARGKFLDAFIAEKNATKSVTITGTHSPEGSERINQNLAQNRANAIQKYYRTTMKRYDYKNQADEIEFITKPIVLDWTPLKDTLAKTDMLSADQKQQVLEIIDGPGDFEEKENRLHRLAFYNRLLLNGVYPKIRTAQTDILTLVEKKPDSELSVIARQMTEGRADTNALNNKEIMWAATLTPDLNEKQAIYETAIKKNDSWQAHNNLAAVQLEKAKRASADAERNRMVDMAITHLEMSKNKQESAEVYNNLAVAYTMKGQAQQAADALSKASQMTGGQEVTRSINAARGIQLIQQAKYPEAVNALSQAGDSAIVLYNKGLAQVLANQNDAAIATLRDAASKFSGNANQAPHAMIHYITAVAAANSKNENLVAESLRKAVSIDSSLRERAMKDLEFADYANSESFKNAIR